MMATKQKSPFDVEVQLKTEALTISQQSSQLVVATPDDYKAAIDFGKGITELRKKIVDYFAPLKDAAHAAHKAICDREKEELQPVVAAETVVKRKVTDYRSEQDRIAREKQRLEEERIRTELEEARKAQVKALKAEGDKALAKKVAAAPLNVPIVDVQSAAPVVSGIRKTTVWKFEVTDARLVPEQFKCVDEAALGAFIRSRKEQAVNAIAGVRVWSEDKTGW